MKRLTSPRGLKLTAALVGIGVLSGCASVSLEQNLHRVNQETAAFSGGQVQLARDASERKERDLAASQLLRSPLGQKEAVQLALLNSASLQALLAQGWADAAAGAQSGRISNPAFSFERMVKGDELELGRALSFGLLDVLTLPVRQNLARQRIEQAQLQLSGQVIDHVTRVRQAWVRAVAAQQTLNYAQQIFEAAEASSELARRMQSAGNFNRLNRAREQAFYADAATRLATAQHQVTSTREELVRLLGLDEAQANILQLPQRLPDLPREALDATAIGSMATRTRLDIQLALNGINSAAKAQGITKITSFTDIELIARRNTTFDNASGSRSTARGFEVDIRLPIFDWGDMQRSAWNARTIAAAHNLEAAVRSAGSNLRESYSAYRTAYDIARHHRDEVVPIRKVISEENQLRYNGMIIGVFELLADAKDQVSTVIAAINAEQQFWLADAALKASVIGRPTTMAIAPAAAAAPTAAAPH